MRTRSSTGAATRAVRSDIARKPANRAATASDSPSAKGRAREKKARAPKRTLRPAGSQRTGSRSAPRLSATPPIAATGSQRKKRRSSTSRASAPAKALRQSGAQEAARLRAAVPDRTAVRAGLDMPHNKHEARAAEREPAKPDVQADDARYCVERGNDGDAGRAGPACPWSARRCMMSERM